MTGRPHPFLAGLLSFLLAGTGQLYAGRTRRGVVLLSIVVALAGTRRLVETVPPDNRAIIVFATALGLAGLLLNVLAAIGAYRDARADGGLPLSTLRRAGVPVGVLVGFIAANLAAEAFLANGRSWSAREISDSTMEPLLMPGDQIISMAGYYRSHEPAANDIVVVRLGQQEQIVRVVATSGQQAHGPTSSLREVAENHYLVAPDQGGEPVELPREAITDRPVIIQWARELSRVGTLIQPARR